jgi:hypothetical protein
MRNRIISRAATALHAVSLVDYRVLGGGHLLSLHQMAGMRAEKEQDSYYAVAVKCDCFFS